MKGVTARRRFVATLAVAPALWLGLAGRVRAAGLKADEQVMLFPSTARRLPDGRWFARVEAWVHELERKTGASQLFARYLGLDLGDLPAQDRARFEARTHLFRADSESGRVLQIRFASGLPMSLPASDSNGRVSTEVVVSAGASAPRAPRWLDYTVVLRNDVPRGFSGSALALPDRGLSVVSDIDDTIKHTQVHDKREMLLNTFARKFAAVPGMANWMRRCAMADSSARLHYVSGGPIQLYPAIAQFLREQAFPRGTVHLRTVDLAQEIFAAGVGARAHKLAAIGQLMSDFPQRRFVLVGDSGEQDPEIYGDLAREHRGRIVAVLVRNVTSEGADALRYVQAMRDLPRNVWTVFDEPNQLPDRWF
jgi:hypothetical protein